MPVRKLHTEDDAGRQVFEEAGVYAHDLDIADVLGVKGSDSGECTGVGGQSAIGGRYAYHHAPIAIETVAKANIDLLGIESLV